ncbi:Na/Pi symporter [Bacillus sp. SM2101]|uniref:Na/Pi symporter n=1 Tax=Bacillus sp. SM2101 TaxID=2805366 RepID=UPI00332C010B
MAMAKIISLFAVYLSIFLFGMTVMRIGLFNISHEKMKHVIKRLTINPFSGFLVGIVVTALLQSSSAVMIITIGLVATGYINFKQSIGIILGTNIGTTFTTEFITIDLEAAILPLIIIGFLFLFTNNIKLFSTGAIAFGLGCLFVAMNGFEQLAEPLSLIPSVQSFLEITNKSGIFGVGLGTFLTAIIQSSTATTGIVMGFMNENVLSLQAGIAIILGSNIGTCITAFLASIGASHEAKLTAYAHIWLNVLGVAIFYPFIKSLGTIAELLTTIPDVQLAHVSVIFNVICSLIALPLTGLIASFIIRIHSTKKIA